MDQGEITLSQKGLHRLHVVKLTLEGRETVQRAAKVLELSERQVRRLRRRVEREGAKGLVHGNRGRRMGHGTGREVVEKVLRLAREKYQGFNDTHLTEKLNEAEGMKLSRATVRRILRRAGVVAVRRRRARRHYRRRQRRAQEGSLLLWDGSPHRWLGEDGPEWTLIGAMDDATGAFLSGVFVEKEDAQGYLTILRQVLLEKGIPLAIYMDRHGIFRRNDDHWTREEELAGEQTPTQVGGALKALGIEPIYALSPQAKGRVERLWGTFQDRLVSELRLTGIRGLIQPSRANGGVSQVVRNREDRSPGLPEARIRSAQPGHDERGDLQAREAATAFLNSPFKADFNRRFAKPARETQPAWRPVPRTLDVDRICSFHYEAVVANDNAVRLGGGIILDIPPGPNRRGYAKARVEVRQLLDGHWRVYYREQLLLETKPITDGHPLRSLRRKLRAPAPPAPPSPAPSAGEDIFSDPLGGHFA